MTDTKNEAPERIWACYGRVYSQRFDTLQPATEYVRADLLADMTRQRDEARASVEALGPVAQFLPAAVASAEKAMLKFPQPNYVISKWAEETGEVTKDLIHMAEGRQTVDKLCGEIVQSLAMLHRLMVEGDQVHGLPPIIDAISALAEGAKHP